MGLRKLRGYRLAALLAVIAMLLAACGDGGDGETDGGETGGEDGGDGGEASGEFTMLHAFTGETDLAGLQAMIDQFEEANPGITVQAEGSNDFESLARTRIGAGNAPDIILHPQPGLLSDFVDQGVVQPLDFIDPSSLQDQLVPGLVDLGTFNDTFYALPMRLSLKSLVWYNKPYFDQQGYEVPETWDDMLALTEQIASDGDLAPWCIGIESGDATGWTATDWIEDVLLRTLGPEDYDRWVTGELDFASPEVKSAIEENIAPIWTNDDYVFGGQEQIVREAFGTSVNGIIGGTDAECVLHRQATFIEGFIAENNPDAAFGEDYDFFFLPEIDSSVGAPALGGGDLAALYTDNEAAKAFFEFLATPESGEGWAAEGGYLSPYAPVFDSSVYPTESARKASDLLGEASAFRFDGSDLMPGDVGSSSQAGSFWLEITEWTSGDQSLDETLSEIDELYDSVSG